MQILIFNSIHNINVFKCPIATKWAGRCIDTDGSEIPDSGQLILQGTWEERECHYRCTIYSGASGCEWHKLDGALGRCSMPLRNVVSGNGAQDYVCWNLPSKCIMLFIISSVLKICDAII